MMTIFDFNLEFKDILTIAISLIALFASIGASWISTQNKRREETRAIRTRVNDLISKILDLRDKQQREFAEANISYRRTMNAQRKLDNSQQAIATAHLEASRIFEDTNERNSMLIYHIAVCVRQVEELISNSEFDLSDVEYLIIARALSAVGDPKAHEMFAKSIQRAKGTSKINNIRDYAWFFYESNAIERGRQQFQEALECIPGEIKDDPDLRAWQAGFTYQLKTDVEARYNQLTQARHDLEEAKKQYEQITAEGMRTIALTGLKNLVDRMPGLQTAAS